jgi:DNA-binding NtrC family response regulator
MDDKAQERNKMVEQRANDVRRAAADYALARDPKHRRDASVATLRALWEIAAASGAPIEGLAVVNKLIQAIEDVGRGEPPSLFTVESNQPDEKKPAGTSSPDLALAAALVDALNQYERMPIQEAIDYVASKRGLSATTLKTARQRLRSKLSKDSGQSHYRTALSTIAAQSDPARAIRVQLLK